MAGILIAVLVVGLCIYGIAFKIYTKKSTEMDQWYPMGDCRTTTNNAVFT